MVVFKGVYNDVGIDVDYVFNLWLWVVCGIIYFGVFYVFVLCCGVVVIDGVEFFV